MMRKNFGSKPWFYPLPVLIIGTYDENEKANAMNAAWGGLYDTDLVELCLSAGHKTTKNILLKNAFTMSFATNETVVASDYVGIVSGNNTPNKMEFAHLTTSKSQFVDAPIINEFPFTLECEYVRQTSEGNIIGRIINISIDDSILDSNGNVDLEKFKPIAFDPVNNEYVEIGGFVAKAFDAGKAFIK